MKSTIPFADYGHQNMHTVAMNDIFIISQASIYPEYVIIAAGMMTDVHIIKTAIGFLSRITA